MDAQIVKEETVPVEEKTVKVKEQKPDTQIELLLSKAWKTISVKQDAEGSVLGISNGKDKLHLFVKQSKSKWGEYFIIRSYTETRRRHWQTSNNFPLSVRLYEEMAHSYFII